MGLIEITIYVTGFLFCVMVLCGLILIFVERTISEIKRRKTYALKLQVMSYTSELSRWCGNEFPHVEKTANVILKKINGDACPNASQFREMLRED